MAKHRATNQFAIGAVLGFGAFYGFHLLGLWWGGIP